MDNFSFMDHWPPWIRWLTLPAFAGAAILLFWEARPAVYSWFDDNYPLRFVVQVLWSLWIAVGVWCCVAAAPRFKVAVALCLGIVSFVAASYVFYILGPKFWPLVWARKDIYGMIGFLMLPHAWGYALGLLITGVLVTWGALRRRLGVSVFGKLVPYLVGASVLLIALSVANVGFWIQQFEDVALRGAGTPEQVNSLTTWFVWREVALIALLALGLAMAVRSIPERVG
ncbi:MAG: hypothetical protein JO194_02385 [Candidatus Eremiobacteraeota bacterium]|nr:hypothetical protein [Candidatus Eremiobacteraeota bacterium]